MKKTKKAVTRKKKTAPVPYLFNPEEVNLPTWAQELIRTLREELESAETRAEDYYWESRQLRVCYPDD